MKKLLFVTLCILVFLPSIGVCEKSNSDDTQPELYHRLSSMSFMYAADLFDALPRRDKIGFAYQLSYIMFNYWAETRKGATPPYKRVDGAIQAAYADVFSRDKRVRKLKVFDDPLLWLLDEKIHHIKPPAVLSDISKDQYLEILPEYLEFLRARLRTP